ncbi:hypothetical protein B9Z55_007464 [Caenorhabditis nigoni]|uniref:Uncharacterized protein n=1 Tax=Caenorhabditis nigoni TaxID=1611254 RepID=A0A2G5V9Q6_9PELO|nr:hypothetical protein B9Z55_007464 [Caenorhabditis nigoni]
MTPITATQLDHLLAEAEKLLNAENEKLKKAIRDQKRANGLKRLAIRQEAEDQEWWDGRPEFCLYIVGLTVLIWMFSLVFVVLFRNLFFDYFCF